MNKITLLFLLPFLLIASFASAQNIRIKGAVYSTSGETIKDITVSLKSASGKQLLSTTDAAGKFSFAPVQKEAVYALKITHLSYTTLDTVISVSYQDTTSVIQLKPVYLDLKINQMNTVTIEAKKKVIEIRGDKVLFNVAQSPIASGKTLYDAIKQMPGVFEQNNTLSYQGKKIAVYIDGRQNYLSGDELKTYLQSQPASTVDQIEVLANPSAKYDAQGGSVMNIKSIVNKNFGTNGSIVLGSGLGQKLQHNEGLNLNYRTKGINIYGSYNHSYSNKYNDTYSDRQPQDLHIVTNENAQQSNDAHSLKAGLDWDLDQNNTIGFLLKGTLMNRKREWKSSTLLDYAGDQSDSTSYVNTTGKSKYTIPSFNVFYKSVLDTSKRTVTLNFDYFKYDKSSQNRYTTTFFDAQQTEYQQPLLLRDNSPTVNEVYAFAADYVNPLKNGSLEAGIKTYLTKTDNNTLWESYAAPAWIYDGSRSNHFIYKELINAAYINYSGTFRKFTVTGGLRYELTNIRGELKTGDTTTNRTYGNLFPAVNIGYNANENNVFGISYRKSIQRFGFDVVNPFILYQNQYAYYQGNPNIKPEISHNFDLNYTYKSFLSFKLNYTKANDALAPVYFNGANNVLISSQDNLSNSSTFYFSNDFYTSVKGIWDISLSNMVGFIKFNQQVDGKNILNNSNWVYQATMSNSFNMGKGWSSEVFVMYLSPFSQGIYKTKTLFETDLGVSKSILNKKANIRFSVNDIFNTYSQRYTVDYQGVNAYYNQKSESQFFNLSFSYKFGNAGVKSSKSRKINADEIRNRMN
jgi:hypothetical protein